MVSMTRLRLLGFSVLTASLLFGAAPLRASDPVGVYCLIDKVVLEPSDTNPTSVQIWGAFSLAVPRSRNGVQTKPAGSYGDATAGDVYAAVQKGYLYYTCPKGREAACRNEWNDLKSQAGKHEVVGFGSRYGTPATVRKSGDKPASPDEYSVNVGVVKMGRFSTTPELVAALDAAVRAK